MTSQLIAEVNVQDGILLTNPISNNQSNLGVDVRAY